MINIFNKQDHSLVDVKHLFKMKPVCTLHIEL